MLVSMFLQGVFSFLFTLHFVAPTQLSLQADTLPPTVILSQQEYFDFHSFKVEDILLSVNDESPYMISNHHDPLHIGRNTICVQAKDIYHNQTKQCSDYQLLNISNQTLATYFTPSLQETIQSYLTAHHISQEQIGLVIHDLTFNETLSINADQPFVAASSIKFPVGVVIYDKIVSQEISRNQRLVYTAKHNEGGTTLLPNYYAYGDAIPITTLLQYMLVYSDNNATQILLDELRRFGDLQELLSSFFQFESSQIRIYQNTVTPAYFMSVLQYVLAHESSYEELSDYLLRAYPSRYLKKYLNDIPILHKCGFYQGNINDVGIVYGSSPYAIVVMTKHLPQAEEHIARINELVYHYKKAFYFPVTPLKSPSNRIIYHEYTQSLETTY